MSGAAWQQCGLTWAYAHSTTSCSICACTQVPGAGLPEAPPTTMPWVLVPCCRLTVEEHVWFYGRLKGLSAAAVGPEQDRLLRDVGLLSKRCAQTRHLSGELKGR